MLEIPFGEASAETFGKIVRQTLEYPLSVGSAYRSPLLMLNDSKIDASPDGDVSFNQTHYGARVLLMIGEERRGLTPEQRSLCDQLVRIPMQDNLDSLNAAVAGSLLLHEVLRPASE